MWSHYADYHKGMCIEFYIDKFPSEFRDVIYEQNIPRLNVPKSIVEKNDDFINTAILTKYNKWEYEDECRLLSNENNIVYPPNALANIYFGCKVSSANILTLASIIMKYNKKHNTTVKLFLSQKIQNEYKLEFS